jgi:murE/murF fusion protein
MYSSDKLKQAYDDIIEQRSQLINFNTIIENKVINLNDIYKKLLNKNSEENSSSLDSLHFQGKLINIQLENNKYIFKIINNKIYCNYYKLYKNIYDYINLNFKDNKILQEINNDSIIKYKDLDNEKEYDIKYTNLVYQYILKCLTFISYKIKTLNIDIEKLLSKSLAGLNIDNYLNQIYYEKEGINNNLDLFSKTLKNFNKLHLKYLLTFFKNVKLFYQQINSDINTEIINNFSTNNIKDLSNSNLNDFLNHVIPLEDIKKNDYKYRTENISDKHKKILSNFVKSLREKSINSNFDKDKNICKQNDSNINNTKEKNEEKNEEKKEEKKTLKKIKKEKRGIIFKNDSELKDFMINNLSNGDYLMVKGSNSTGLFNFISKLKQKNTHAL